MTDMREAPSPQTGELLDGRYRLEESIGEGASARVYRARDTLLERTVAVKILRGPFDDAAIGRAVSETRVLASLNHHALVTLFDARIAADEVSYLAMEHVDGMTLRDLLASGPVPSETIAAIAVDLAEALHAAHSAGIVHRDIKPSNVLLTHSPLPGRPWRAKLADFGIAYLLDTARVTTPGLVVGTVAYIAPEQARGDHPSPPADIYAFGILLLEALSGVRPFSDFEGIGTVVARMHRAPDIPEHLDARWRGLLRGMTTARPDDRPTALEVADAASRLTAAGAGVHSGAGADIATTAIRAEDPPTLVAPTRVMPPASAPLIAPPPLPLTSAAAAAARPTTQVRGRRRRRSIIGAVGGAAAAVAIGLALLWAAPAAAPPAPSSVSTPAPRSTPATVSDPTTPTPAPAAGTSTTGQRAGTTNANDKPDRGPGNNKGNGKGGPGADKGKPKGK